MAAEQQVRIVGWPDAPPAQPPLTLAHRFEGADPLPVAVSFAESAARVVVSASQERPLQVNMDMALRALDRLPFCIALCEPLCVESAYTIGITIFDRPVITITIRGRTRLFGAHEEL